MNAPHPAIAALLAQPRLARVLAALDGDGEETRVVGGAVRNALLGLPVADVDLATTATPDETTRRARSRGLRVVPTGISHGTVTVLVEGQPFEVTTLRRDVATDGRRAVVAFGRDFDADAQRRDFTMNALSAGRDGAVFDPVGGLADLAARKVRFIGDARRRIAEDYLRILRLFRFHAAYGEGPLDAEAREAAIAGRAGLAHLSAERIAQEMKKLCKAPRAPEALTEMADAGLLDLVLGGVAYVDRFARAVAIEPGLDAVGRLAAYAVATREDVARLRERLRLSNATTGRLDAIAAILASRHGLARPDDAVVDTLLFRFEREAARDALSILWAQAPGERDDDVWAAALRRASDAERPTLPVRGDDLLARGVPPGRAVGAALKALQAKWIRAGFPRDPLTIQALVDAVVSGGA